jgi:NAD(P)-dependent dehydrogenase (short-subunit alcohol dehydrogenase family)
MYLERFKLDGRVAVVTGGAQAIGFACVEALAEGGAHVYIADRSPAAGKEAQAALDAKGVQVDFIEMDVTIRGRQRRRGAPTHPRLACII